MILPGTGNCPGCGVIHNRAIIQQTMLKTRCIFAYIMRETSHFAFVCRTKIGSESTA